VAVSEGLVPDLAGAVLDGTPIDWAAAESSADEANRPLLAELRVLAILADLHRRLPLPLPAATLTGIGDCGEQVEHWGHLRVLERIGGGAFGEVYRAWDTRLDREVALKLLPADRAAGDGPASSIIQEGRLLARVRHPNVVTIYGAEQIGGRIGLWMEFVRGRTLKQIVDDGKVFSGAEAIEIGVELCQAVAAVHNEGLLHRDIKAQNVMLAENGRAMLMDFGTGRELADNSTSDLAGTPLYLAPEILAGHEATVQSDIYSLGVLLYHLVTGSYPIRARSLRDVRLAHARNERTSIRAARAGSDLSPKLSRIIERAIDPLPEGRYQSADTVAADLMALKPRPTLVSFTYAMGVAAALILVIGLGWEVLGRHVGSSRTPGALLARVAGGNPVGASNVTPVEQPIIAVLPFKNLSVEPGSEYFVDGLTDEIIRILAVIQGLQVRSQTSSFTFKDKPRNLRDVGEQLGANLVVEGSVLRSGNTLRINAQLIQVAGDRPLWSARFDRELKDVFVVQDEISRAIVNELRLTLGRGQRRYDTNVEAYELYLKGRVLIGRLDIPSLEKAADLFQQVIAKDPAFAPAHAGLANAYALMSEPTSSNLPFETAHSILRTAAVKARELDPLLADAHAAMGWAYSYERDWTNAEKSFQRAIELNPILTETYTSYSSSTLRPLGKLDEALGILRVASRYDPLSLDVQRQIGVVQFFAGRYAEAIDTFQRVRAVEPDFPFVETWLGRALTFAGRLAEALPMLERTDGRYLGRFKTRQARRSPWLAQAYVMTGRRAEAATLAAEHADSPSNLATIYASLGDKDRAFEALERVAVVQPHHVGKILINPEMTVLRGDPRLAPFRKRFNLP
jgi:TolB-like protein/Tfp pilus assembly protein PilF/tRNA A-37 threonylcarbamoyl transferase component Bud32